MAFIGGYRHAPNVDAAHWLTEAVMPLVWQHDPSVECLLVGSDMPEALRRITRAGIAPLGHVPDLASVFDRVRLTVAPLRFGAGLKGKVLHSLAHGVPCVMTPVAAEGLALDGTLAGLVAEDAPALAAAIRRLHGDAGAHAAAAAAGLALMTSAFSAGQVEAALGAAIGPRARRAAGSVRRCAPRTSFMVGPGYV